jgi:hypothetical protein
MAARNLVVGPHVVSENDTREASGVAIDLSDANGCGPTYESPRRPIRARRRS